MPLYRENTRPRQLRGYLAFCGLDGALDRLADDVANARARRAFHALVPEAVAEACELLLFRDGELCLYVHQGAWATWLRNRAERLVEGLREQRTGVSRLRVVVAPRGAAALERPVEKPVPPSADAPALVQKSAAMATDPDLKRSLDRLARRLAKCREDSNPV